MLCYHKNVATIYPKEWIEAYRESVMNQTYQEFEIFEMNYGGGTEIIFDHSYFESFPYDNFVHALNYLLDKCFHNGYDYVFNSNVDDVFATNRIEKQLPYLIDGYDIVSSNFCLVQDDEVVKYHHFDKMDIQQQLDVNHNILCHPVIGYSAAFWRRHRYIPEQLPYEDMMLWQRAIKDSKFIILKDNLLFHRIHQNAVCRSENK